LNRAAPASSAKVPSQSRNAFRPFVISVNSSLLLSPLRPRGARFSSRFVLATASALTAVTLTVASSAYAAGELQQAEQMVESGRATEAIALIARFGRSNDPSWAQVHSAALLATGQSRRAVDLLAPLHAADPLNLSLANNYAVALEAIGATDTARQVLERALGDGQATAAAFRNLRSIYAKLAAASYARATDSKMPRVTPTLALVMPTARQPLAFTAGNGESGPTLVGGMAPAPTIPPLAAIGTTMASAPAAKPAPTTAPAAVAAPPIAASPAPAPASSKPTQAATPTVVASAGQSPASGSAANGSTASGSTATGAASNSVNTAPAADKGSDRASDKVAEKPAEKPADKPATDRNAAVIAQLERATHSWAAAWSKKDVSGYLGFYAKSFQPPTGLSRSEWEKQRRQRIDRPGPIRVEVEDFKGTPDGDGWRLSFRQHYKASNLQSSSIKTLRWVQEGGRWVIQVERAQ